VQPHLFIRIPARPTCVEYGPEDQGHATIEEIPPDSDEQSVEDQSKRVSTIPDFPQGTTRSGKQHGEIQCLLASEDAEYAIVMAVNIMGEPQNIYDTLNLPGDEGEEWERARQAEWQNMVDPDVFGPPEHPPPNTHIIKWEQLCIRLSRLVYIGSKAYVSERRRPNTADPEGLVRRRYVVGKEDQTSSNRKMYVSNS
jgi:hypothetical protein